MVGLVSVILFLISVTFLSACQKEASDDYLALAKEYDKAHEAQMNGDLQKALDTYKDCVNQCSQEKYMDDDSVKLLLPRAMGQLMNTFQSQSDQTGCVAYFDSLKREVDDVPTIYNKVLQEQFKRDVYVFLSYSLSRTDNEQKAALLMDQALKMPLSYPTPERNFRDYAYAAGVYYCVPNQEDKVLKYGRKALDEVKICQNKSGAQWIVVVLGGIYHRKSEVDKAIAMYQEGYELAALANDTLGMANAKREIADYLLQWNLYGVADKFATQAVQLVEHTNNSNPMVETCIYVTKSKVLKAQNNKAKALGYLKKAKSSSAGLPYNSGVSDVDLLLGSLLINKEAPSFSGDYEHGIKLLQYASHEGTPKIKASAFLELAKAHIAEGKLQLGEMELDSMYVLSHSMPAASAMLEKGYEFAYQYYERQDNHAQMALYGKALNDVKTKSELSVSVKNVINAITKLEIEEKENSLLRQQEKMAKRRIIIISVIGVLVVLLLLSTGGFFWQRRKTKRKLAPVKRMNEKVNLIDVLQGDGLEAFKMAFDQAHPSFVNALRAKILEVSTKEELYCRVIALGVDNGELAEIFHVARPSVNIAKYRLRKKMTLEENQTLEEVISQLLE